MSWPTPQDYNEAVQNPKHNFADPELQTGEVELNRVGLPRVASGAFASVYRIHCASRDVALRCFLTSTQDQQARYDKISRFVCSDDLEYTVAFEYLPRGIRVHSAWYPVLKMEWVQGKPLDIYVRDNVNAPAKLLGLANEFKKMAADLNRAGIAHGDLQHGNIMILDDGRIRLVDYDGMYVPELKGTEATELGHRNYQHPGRQREHFDQKLDNFSIWSIYTSLVALAEQPKLLTLLGGGDECLLFRQVDYRFPLRSPVFRALEFSENEKLQQVSKQFRSLVECGYDKIPFLDEEFEVPIDLVQLPLELTVSVPDSLPSVVAQIGSSVETERWATVTDYMLAASNPRKAFKDHELQSAILALDHGALRPVAGENGAVFKYHLPNGKDVAVKVFFNPDTFRKERYVALSEYLNHPTADSIKLMQHLPKFHYLEDGILVNGKVCPVVKMEWVEGLTLFDLLDEQPGSRETLNVANKLIELMQVLQASEMTHGDLEPDNIMLRNGQLILVDLDTVQLRTSRTFYSKQPINKNFAHPATRTELLTEARRDDFAAWVIYTSLQALSSQPSLWQMTGVKPGRLLFKNADLAHPRSSTVFDMLSHHWAKSVRDSVSTLATMCSSDPAKIPPFAKSADNLGTVNPSGVVVARLPMPSGPTGLQLAKIAAVAPVLVIILWAALLDLLGMHALLVIIGLCAVVVGVTLSRRKP